jgi:hypothetical protein
MHSHTISKLTKVQAVVAEPGAVIVPLAESSEFTTFPRISVQQAIATARAQARRDACISVAAEEWVQGLDVNAIIDRDTAAPRTGWAERGHDSMDVDAGVPGTRCTGRITVTARAPGRL